MCEAGTNSWVQNWDAPNLNDCFFFKTMTCKPRKVARRDYGHESAWDEEIESMTGIRVKREREALFLGGGDGTNTSKTIIKLRSFFFSIYLNSHFFFFKTRASFTFLTLAAKEVFLRISASSMNHLLLCFFDAVYKSFRNFTHPSPPSACNIP